jgi:predicted O-linked N-acetylglucosamine transferase (SPINDLY family)
MLKWLTAKFETRKAGSPPPQGSSLHLSAEAVDAAEWRKRGNAHLGDGRLEDAEQCYRNGIDADPTDAVCHSNLGYVLFERQQWDEAKEVLTKAVERNPNDSDAYYLLGNLSRYRDERKETIASYRRALEINPNFDICRRDLCVVLAQSGQPKEAQRVMGEGPAFGADTLNQHYFSGNLYMEMNNNVAAVASFLLAKQLKPQDVGILINLGMAQLKLGDYHGAMQSSKEILAFQPDNAMAYSNIAAVYQMTGKWEKAIENYRIAIRLSPHYLAAHQNLLFNLTYLPNGSPTDYLRDAQDYGQKVSARARPFLSWQHSDPSKSKRPLRVGFLSADLHFHPVSLFLMGVLSAIDPNRVICFAYSSLTTEDAISEYLKKIFIEWNRVSTLTDEELAGKIHADGIDILVDLSGHTGQTRLPVFAWRPAPVQVTWLGYWASTGVAEIDYILADRTTIHEDEAQYYSEVPWLLPDTRLCFSPPVSASPIMVTALPALRKGHVTFATYQSPTKISDTILALWSQVLASVRLSRLRLHGWPLDQAENVSDIKRRLSLAGIDLDRVDLLGRVVRDEYLKSYAEVDVVLDTFPYPGGTTTAEALWMGVPTLTLAGKTMLSRQGVSMLDCVGLEDWVANTEQEYVQKAIQKVTDLDSLASLRAGLRATALASPLFDGERFARNLVDAFEGMAKAKIE